MGEEMAMHSSVLAGKIPWTDEPGRLQFEGSQSRTQLSMRANKAKRNKSGPGRRPAPLSTRVGGEGMPLVSAGPVSKQDSVAVSESLVMSALPLIPQACANGSRSPGLPPSPPTSTPCWAVLCTAW